MTAYPAWTPAPRPGIVPLHPFGFGTILGRSFVALRQNPKVLLGFALCVQIVSYLVLLGATGGVAFATFSRLETLQPGTDDFEAVMVGSIAATAITGFVLGLATAALGVIVQGIVVSEVASAVVAEKPTLGEVWRRVKPVAWRLIGYTFLVSIAALVAIAVVGALLFAIGVVVVPLAVVLGILAVLGAIPLSLWLTTKLLVVPAVIILEHATLLGAIARSWRLTRNRFWPTLGIVVIISVTFGAIAQVISIPTSLLSLGLGSSLAPTGDPDVTAIIASFSSSLLTQVLTLFVQCVAVIVQSTASALVYVDCRMRHEGLDLDLQAYVERRDAGATDLVDPFRENVGRAVAPRPPQYGHPQPGGYPPPYPGRYGAPPQRAAPADPSPSLAASPRPSPQHPAPPRSTSDTPAPAQPAPADPSPTRWSAPGEGS